MFTPILLYHSISNQAQSKFIPWVVQPRLFEEQMAYLRDAGYQSLTVTEYISLLSEGSGNIPSKAVVITFDDGFADFYHTAVPILNRYEMKATVYLSTRYIGSTSLWLESVGEGAHPMLTWEEIREIHDSGFECGAHAHRHRELDILPAWTAWQEIYQCKTMVEEQLDQPIFSFAYPRGYYNSGIKEMVQQAGFYSACAERNLINSAQDDLFALARLIIPSDMDLPVFQSLLEGKGEQFIPQRKGMKAKSWRGIRWLSARFNPKLEL